MYVNRKSQVNCPGGIALKVSPDTVLRDWRLAKVWLYRELKNSDQEL